MFLKIDHFRTVLVFHTISGNGCIIVHLLLHMKLKNNVPELNVSHPTSIKNSFGTSFGFNL